MEDNLKVIKQEKIELRARLMKLYREQNISIRQISIESGVSYSSLYMFMNGQSMNNANTLKLKKWLEKGH